MHGLWPCVPVYSLLDELGLVSDFFSDFVSDLLAGLSLLVLVLVLVLVLAVLDSLLVVLPGPVVVVLVVLEVLGDPAASIDFELSDFGLSDFALSTFSPLGFELLALSFL